MYTQKNPEIFDLTPGERGSTLWNKISEHLYEELEHERLALEKDQPEMSTAAIRGKIRAIRHMLTLNEERQTTDDQPLPM